MQMKIHYFNFSKERIFLFEFENVNFEFYVHVMKVKTADVLIQNDEKKSLNVTKFLSETCY